MQPKALFFDTFGTVVEWRSCVTTALGSATQQALADPSKIIPTEARARASQLTTKDWASFAEEWRKSYAVFTRNFDASENFVSVDQHHYTALQDLLSAWGLRDLFSDDELWDLTFAWHRLSPWPDSVSGLDRLNTAFVTATLSNGNISLLEDLKKFGSLPFQHLVSAENFGAYKPSPEVYLGAAKLLGFAPSKCALVAAHLHDLKAAKSCGFHTIYVEREAEDTWDAEQVVQAREEGFVDIWIDLDTGGFNELARILGI